MGSQNDTATDSRPSEWYDSNAAPTEELDVVRLNAARAKAADEMAAAIARELNGPLTALLLYMGEIKHHSDQLAPVTGDRAYLQRVVENALVQTERVCGLVKQLAGSPTAGLPTAEAEPKLTRAPQPQRVSSGEILGLSGQKRLTKREGEVLRLISEGYSNKQGALRMQISPRTFESHRAEAMRKLGARNTADLVRAALLHSID
ncbi:DNA-binding CsgD family transcriptional regulator [Bradyrhizobium sp. JR4.1]|uniref:LuxR C-terminal-related transcriptional regulator n=1 Tax=unclassified Bradyrhizobium TaxID=2631580 RepID=UPI00025D2D9C|nr:helix-turn-helix transcriptional regulator [Bradyrhizobium sp. WSM1253]EIG60479.1 response regulator containing a CheY-like receiver domain and an HTH DNA-binding domain [Bradyrhizobium sp. WSM1253]